ncbi:MAG TPA: hypothetical protein VLG37_05090 [Candidatus Saccharimonadales bacterium]|nr:hypothetical protein [Candidatus Saccharimonadales bacterium]
MSVFPEQLPLSPEKAFYEAAHKLLVASLLGDEEDALPPSPSPAQLREALKRILFKSTMWEHSELRQQEKELEALKQTLPQEVRLGADVFRLILPQVLIEESLVKEGLREAADSISCPYSFRIEDFSAALVLASRATGITFVGEFNSVNLVATPETQPADLNKIYYGPNPFRV